MNAIEQAQEAVERTPEHELRRLLERMAVTDPLAVRNGVERMFEFDRSCRAVTATERNA